MFSNLVFLSYEYKIRNKIIIVKTRKISHSQVKLIRTRHNTASLLPWYFSEISPSEPEAVSSYLVVLMFLGFDFFFPSPVGSRFEHHQQPE